MATKYDFITKEYLVQRYLEQDRNIDDIAVEANCSYGTIFARLKKFDIPIKVREKDISNQDFGRWSVLHKDETKKKQNTYWVCKCKCGHVQSLSGAELRLQRSQKCKKCQEVMSRTMVGQICKSMMCKIWHNAKSRNLDFDIDADYIWKLYEIQDGKCALSGKPIEFAKTARGHAAAGSTASLDRIDSKLGYVKGNLQWVHKDINRMKQHLDQKYFIEMCREVAKHNV